MVRKISVGYHDRFNPHLLDNALTIFLYHDISDNPREFSRLYHLNVTPELFEFQINVIKKHFNLISPDDLNRSKLPSKPALITFDDGFKSVFKTAVPILERYAIPSLIFLNIGPVKGELFWSGLITYLCNKSDFVDYLKTVSNGNMDIPLFLKCSRQIVDKYMDGKKSLKGEVFRFVGEFASMEDLFNASKSHLIFYGNHLYNHYIPKLMTDNDFTESYKKNEDEIKGFSNYLNMFSFPFGQPGTCFSNKHIDLLTQIGAKKVFTSTGSVNYDRQAYLLDRISLSEHYNSEEKIKFQIIKHRLHGN